MNRNWQTFLETRNLKPKPAGDPESFTAVPSVIQAGDYGVLQVTGEDAATFLQGQTTCDVLGLQNNRATWGAVCNTKGRALTTFLLFIHPEGYRLIVPKILVEPVEKRLRMYILRSRVALRNITDSLAIFGLCCGILPERLKHEQRHNDDPRYPVIHAGNWQLAKVGANQWLFIGSAEEAERHWTGLANLDGFSETSDLYWRLLSILNGIPILEIRTSEEFVPQMINLDALGGISFKKGCYTGQEIVARMHYLGKLKRRMYLASTRSDQPPNPGDPLYVSGNDQSIGQIVNAAYLRNPEIRLLAVLHIEQAESGRIRLPDPTAPPLKILELPYTF